VNLSRAPFVRVSVPGALVLPSLEIPEVLTRTVLVTVPVMKTHAKTVLSGGIKNQWGCLPKFRHNYHPVVDEALRDLTAALRPALTILDGTVALEGNGPKSGRPRICNLILASRDPVALDTVAGRIMGLDAFPVRHLDLCARAGFGERDWSRIDVIDGQGRARSELPRLNFRPARPNPVSVVETFLRTTAARRLIFESPLLRFFCWGARLWYFLWYYVLGGRGVRDAIVREYPAAGPWPAAVAGRRPDAHSPAASAEAPR
jgi:hypothetical protein